MPAGYSARCRVCNSQHRAQVEEWIVQGLSPRAISAKLVELGEKISHVSIWQHRREHFNVKQEAALQYQASQQQLEKAAARRVSEIEQIDQVIERSARLNMVAAAWLDELLTSKEKPPKALVDLYSVTAAEIRQQAKAKQELLGETPADDLAEVLMRLVGDDDHTDA